MKKRMVVLVMALLVIGVVACTTLVDPATGEKTYAVKESVAKGIETVGTTAEAVGPAVAAGVTAINPVAGGIVSTILGIALSLFGCYKKWRVPLTESTIMLDKVSAGLRAAGDVIETVVKPNVELWAKAKPVLKVAEANGAVNGDKI